MHTSERAATLWGLAEKTSSCHQKLSSAALVNFTRNRRHIPAPTKRKPTVGAPRHRSRSFSSWSVVLLFFPIFSLIFLFSGPECLALLRLQQQSYGAREHCGSVTSGHFHKLFTGAGKLLCARACVVFVFGLVVYLSLWLMMDNGGTDEARRWTCIESKGLRQPIAFFNYLMQACLMQGDWVNKQLFILYRTPRCFEMRYTFYHVSFD